MIEFPEKRLEDIRTINQTYGDLMLHQNPKNETIHSYLIKTKWNMYI